MQNEIDLGNLSYLNETFIDSIPIKGIDAMHRILGRDYITRKEAATRYGLSVAWFKARQNRHEEPRFIKLRGTGRVYYDVLLTDEWFKNNMKESE